MYHSETRFLIVDDFKPMRKIVRKILNELGYFNIEEADDGGSALPMLKNASTTALAFQFIISDWNMPGMPGIDLLKACKSDSHLSTVPFLLVTAESEQKNMLEAAQYGVSDFVVKPFNTVTFKSKLERIYAKHSSQLMKVAA